MRPAWDDDLSVLCSDAPSNVRAEAAARIEALLSATVTTPLEVSRLVERLIAFRDMHPRTQREERDLLADACNALDGYAKLLRAIGSAP